MNAYIPKFVPKDLPWYERNSLMTWYDQGQCEDFLRDTDQLRSLILVLFRENVEEKKCQKISCNIIKLLGIKVFLSIQHLIRTKLYQALLELIGRTFFSNSKTIKRHFNKKFKAKSILLHINSF